MSTSPTRPTPQKTRRTHTKSRGGCMECKRRKLKCNEAKPVCGGCTKREITCVYPKVGLKAPASFSKDAGQSLRPSAAASISTIHPANDHDPNPNPTVSQSGTVASSPNVTVPGESSNSAAPVRGIGEFNMEDMTLWHQFIYKTASTLSTPWGHELPSLALNCPYLLHGILSLGALHFAYLNPAKRESYSYLASHHYDLAIRPFQKAMGIITPENANQLFAFSTLLIVINYASDRSPGLILPFSEGAAHDGISNWMGCLRGCSVIFETASAHVEQGPLGFLFTQGKALQEILSTGARPAAEDDNALSQIKDVVLNLPSVKTSTTVEEMEAYYDAIERLRALLAASAQPLDLVIKRAVCSIWPTRVSDTYVRLLSEKRPPAMIIMAHYCLLLRGLEDCWYMEHRGLNLFQIVLAALGDEWAIYVEHPRREFLPKSVGR